MVLVEEQMTLDAKTGVNSKPATATSSAKEGDGYGRPKARRGRYLNILRYLFMQVLRFMIYMVQANAALKVVTGVKQVELLPGGIPIESVRYWKMRKWRSSPLPCKMGHSVPIVPSGAEIIWCLLKSMSSIYYPLQCCFLAPRAAKCHPVWGVAWH